MELKLGMGLPSVQAMCEALTRLSDGFIDLCSVARYLKNGDSEALEACGNELASDAMTNVSSGGSFAEQLAQMCCMEPLTKLRSGELLTMHEYYAMRMWEILPNFAELTGVTTEGEFRTYQLLHYNGGKEGPRGTIMTDIYKASRRSGGIRPLEFCPIQPEDVCRERLHRQQQLFFRRYFPSEFMRMKS